MTLRPTPAGESFDRGTESSDARFAAIDTMTVAELADAMNAEDARVPGAVAAALPAIVTAIDTVIERMKRGGRLIYVGAGTPGRIAVLDASECPPTFGTDPQLVFAIIAGGDAALINAKEGAEDDIDSAVAAIDAAAVGESDVVVGIASSGRTPFVLAAVEQAKKQGAATIGLSCNEGTPLSSVSEHPIEILVGPEIISGSTRLKAGTAQKLVLNMISTISMVALGRTYGNLMVDVRASNAKLRERAVRIVSTVAAIDAEHARAALESASFQVKPTIVSLQLGLSLEDAESLLDHHGGRLRDVLGGGR